MINLDLIHSKYLKFREVQSQTTKYRTQWKNTTKPELVDVLGIVSQPYGNEFSVFTNDEIINKESVHFTLGHIPSEIKTVGGPVTHFGQKGGTLSYYQLANGRIFVKMTSPTIDGIKKALPEKHIGLFAPVEINADLIVKHVKAFIDFIIEWHNDNNDINQW